MFKVEKNNEKVGQYIANLIDNKYESRRAFCREYISLSGGVVTDDSVSSMSNRLSQIIKGRKAI